MFPPNFTPSFTPKFHLELFSPLGVGWREDATAGAILDENMAIIDAALGSGGGGSPAVGTVNQIQVSDGNGNFVASAATATVAGSIDIPTGQLLTWGALGTTGLTEGPAGTLCITSTKTVGGFDGSLKLTDITSVGNATFGLGTPSGVNYNITSNQNPTTDPLSGDYANFDAELNVTAAANTTAFWFNYVNELFLRGTKTYKSAIGIDSSVGSYSSGAVEQIYSISPSAFSGGGAVTRLYGIQSSTNILTGATATNNRVNDATLNFNGGVGTNNAAFYVESPNFSGAGSATHLYGLYIEDITVGGAANPDPWAIYAVAGKTYLGGAVTGHTTIDATTGFKNAGGATSGHVLRGDGTNFVDAQLAFADTSGTVGLARGGTNADLSATGGSTLFLAQAADHSISARQPAYTDVSGLSTVAHTGAWSDLQNATGALTLANGTSATTFNQTSAVNWLWANTTAATATAAGAPSPLLNLSGTYFTLGASAADTWAIQNVLSTPHLSSTVTNMAETSGSVVTLTITGGNFAIGDVVTFTGLTKATWLNGQNATLITVSATSLTFNDPVAGHNPTTTGAETGQVTQANPTSTLTIGHSGSAQTSIIIPTNVTTVTGTVAGLAFSGTAGYGISRWGNSLIFVNGATPRAMEDGNGFHICSGDRYLWSSASSDVTVGLTGVSDTGIGRLAAASIAFGNGTNGDFSAALKFASGIAQGTFAPTYGTTAQIPFSIAPTINQAAVTDTIAGVQVTGGNLVTLVFADNTSTFTSGATTLTVAAVTNTTVNGSGNTIASYVRRTGITVVTNSAEAAVTNVVTLSMANTGSMATNDYVSITGLTVATWLNGKVVKLTGVSANVSITFVDPTGHGLKTSGAEGGGVVICHYLTYSKTISNITLGSDTGTATQQATGSYTALNIAVVETALGGTPNYLINCLAGAAGTTQVFAVDNLGAMYLAKAAAGAPTSVGTAGTLGQIVRYGGVLYFCSVTGAAGSATWNSLNMTAV